MPGLKATLKEYKAGKLHSGSKHGPLVKSRKQAIAIAISEEDRKTFDRAVRKPWVKK